METSLRPAGEDDLERIVEIHTSAFPDPRGHDARMRNFTGNPLGALSDLWLLATGGSIVAHAFLFPLEAWYGGRRVPFAGVASVAVAPEARGRGLGTRLIEHLHATARARGDVLTVLYPFRQGFYARLGYAPSSSYRRLRLSPASIPWRCDMRARPARGGDMAQLRACWDAVASRHSGRLARTERLWEARLSAPGRTWLVVESGGGEGGAVRGYVSWTLDQEQPHAATTLVVREMCALDAAADRALWGLIGAQRDQVAVVHADVAEDDPIHWALVDADRGRAGDAELEHAVGDVASGPMVCVLDPRRALEARGYGSDGSVVVSILSSGRGGDPSQTSTLEVAVTQGQARVAPSQEAPHVQMDASALAAVAFGGCRAVHAARLGWLEARDGPSLERADALFALPPYFSPDPF
jgi:predicted acetyltransferase